MTVSWLVILLFLAGLLLVVVGSDLLVDGASAIARRSGLSEFVIGLTIVGIGTSTPEMVVSFLGAIEGNSDISVGNIIGSNIFNTCLILGITAVILPLTITRRCLRIDIPFNIGATLLLILFALKFTIFSAGSNSIGRIEGIVMLLLFVLYMYLSFKNGHDESPNAQGAEPVDKPLGQKSVLASILMVVGGLAALVYGGRLFVDNAVVIAKYLGWSDKFIAITVLAAGTSLPELATCVVAAIKKKGQLALGNILGSNISNILLIVGGSAVIHPLSMENIKPVDFSFVLLAAFFILVSYFSFDKRKLDRSEGVVLLLIEAIYMYLLIQDL